ncbi:MAG: arylsulfatase A [Bacteroidia bacterium]|jgi:arylsulfatase A
MPTPSEMGYNISDGYTSNEDGGGKNSELPRAQKNPKLIWSIIERTIAFARAKKAADRPFFLQLSHYAVHVGIFYRQGSLTEAKEWTPSTNHYDPCLAAMTTDIDAGIGQLLDNLEALGVVGNIYIFSMSDNGGRRTLPRLDTPNQPRNQPLHGAKHSLYEGGIRVPLIVVGPGVTTGALSKDPVTGLDILPTPADLAGYKEPLPDDIDGGSIRGVLQNNGVETVAHNLPFLIFLQAGDRRPITALIAGDFKLMKREDCAAAELFDLSNDLGETSNVASTMQKKRASGQASTRIPEKCCFRKKSTDSNREDNVGKPNKKM